MALFPSFSFQLCSLRRSQNSRPLECILWSHAWDQMPALTNTKLPLCIKSLVPDSYMRFVLAFDVTFSPPKYNRMWFIIFKTYHPKVEDVRHIGDFVTFLIPVQTAFQGLSKWFYFTTLIVTTPYSGFNIGFSRLLLGYDKLSPICASNVGSVAVVCPGACSCLLAYGCQWCPALSLDPQPGSSPCHVQALWRWKGSSVCIPVT